jgi:hypothetical protein
MKKWLAYSGMCVIIVVNPLHWRWVPRAQKDVTDWPDGPNEWTGSVSWLFLTVRVWIDDGSW